MLSEDILEELTRSSALQPDLVRLAWPSLSTESKLQLIQALQNGLTISTPNWLIDLALTDASPIVRFWAARYAYLPESVPENPLIFSIAPSEEDVARWAVVQADPESLVSACAKCESSTWLPESLIEQPQYLRILAIRRLSRPDFTNFIEWLEKALAAGVADMELQECIHEFFAHPGLKEELELPEAEQDPYGAYSREQALEKGWELTKVAGGRTQRTLAFALPLQVGQLGRVKTDLLEGLPGPVIDALLFRTGPKNAGPLSELRERILANPESYPPEAQKALSEEANDLIWVDDERIRRHLLMARPDIGKATLRELFSMTDRLTKMEERMVELEQVVQDKKGIIW